jgi:lipoprotein signal peptidase
MDGRSYRGLLWTLALLGALADQGAKYGIFAALYHDGHGGSQTLIPGAFELLVQFTGEREQGTSMLARLRTIGGDSLPRVNHGALFGMASEHGRLANAVFAGISFLAATAIIFWSTRRSLARDWLLCTCLGLILGGTVGNLYDRLVFNGVRDFLHWHLFEFPVFNIADSCLVVGAILLLAQVLFHRPVPATSEPMPAEAMAQTP